MTASGRYPDQLHRCGVCRDTGWMEIKADGRSTVARCRRGCEAPNKAGAKRPEPASKQGSTFS